MFGRLCLFRRVGCVGALCFFLTACGSAIPSATAPSAPTGASPAAPSAAMASTAAPTSTSATSAAAISMERTPPPVTSSAGAAGAARATVYTAPSETRTDFRVWADDTYPFEIALPRSWYLAQLRADHYTLVVSDAELPATSNAVVSLLVLPTLGKQVDPTATVDTATRTLAASPGMTNFATGLTRAIEVNGLRGQERVYTYEREHKALQHRVVYLFGANHIYSLGLLAEPARFTDYETLFNDMLATFKGA